MDRGEAFKQDMRIKPCDGGSFLVRVGDDRDYGQTLAPNFAFTNVSDLLDWLVSHAQAFSADKIADQVTTHLREVDVVPDSFVEVPKGSFGNLTEGDVVKPKPTIRSLEAILAAEDDTPVQIMPDGSIRIRRTSAAEKMFPYAGMSAVDIVREASTEPKPAA